MNNSGDIKSTPGFESESQNLSETPNSDGTSQIPAPTTIRTRRHKSNDEVILSPTFPKPKSTTELRKSLRSRVFSNRSSQSRKRALTGSRSRRHVLKKDARKLAISPALITLKNCVFHENVWYRVGDIVSLLDMDGEVYYAQIRGLATDFVGDNCCFLTWLIPVSGCRDEEFRPSDYIIEIRILEYSLICDDKSNAYTLGWKCQLYNPCVSMLLV
uniref:BAH domain-containing protein n=1 Tax=Trichobilharzia regenti TaxID=157069 RepID=A0AA85KMV2_TRIRE|nr:unnamed protein product [Trichobilharzia regenti]